ncbi:MAG: alginate export family protein [Planctomycetes bacterium]|nr:alginate export family protein [Planctomycetota bacterium]
MDLVRTIVTSLCVSLAQQETPEPGAQEPPVQEKPPQKLTLEKVLEDMLRGLQDRPEEEGTVLERARRLEEKIQEIEKRPDREKWKEDLEHAKKQLEELRGTGWWGLGMTLVPLPRFRTERRDHVDPALPQTSGDTLTQFRWGAWLETILNQSVRMQLLIEQTRTWEANHGFLRQQDRTDLHRAKLDFRFYDYDLPLELSVGRMRFEIGEERMVGDDSWSNYDRSFDGARFFHREWLGEPLKSAYLDIEPSWGRPVTVEPGQTDDRDMNASDPDVNLYAFSTTLNLLDGTLLGLYFLKDDDLETIHVGERGVGGRRIESLGLRLKHDILPMFEVKGEGVWQWGSFAEDDHRAWAVHGAVRLHAIGTEPLMGVDLFGRGITFEVNFASGDRDPADGNHGTFLPPYPSSHALHGLADLVGWRNMQEYAVRWEIGLDGLIGINHEEDSGQSVLSVEIGFHRFFLAEERDGYYGPRGELIRRVPAGDVSRELGEEVDVALDLAGVISIGYARFQAGEFLSESGGGEDGDLFYFNFGYGF